MSGCVGEAAGSKWGSPPLTEGVADPAGYTKAHILIPLLYFVGTDLAFHQNRKVEIGLGFLFI